MNGALSCHPITDGEKRAVCEWRYEGEYAVYNYPSYEEMKQTRMGFMDPHAEGEFFSFCEEGRLIGIVRLRPEEQGVCVGIAVHPDLCGKGYGRRMLGEARRVSRHMYPEKAMFMFVRAWNRRAIACYLAAGFRQDGEAFERETPSGGGTFIRMVQNGRFTEE